MPRKFEPDVGPDDIEDEKAGSKRPQPPFEHPSKMDVASNGKRSAGAGKSDDAGPGRGSRGAKRAPEGPKE